MPIVGQFGSLAGLGSLILPGGAFESIATVTGTGSSTELSFTSIPSTYQHLQIRGIVRSDRGSPGVDSLRVKFNTNAATRSHYLDGDGSAVYAGSVSSSGYIGEFPASTVTANVIGAFVLDVLDYASTSKTTVYRSLIGSDRNGGGWIEIASGLWNSTDAVTGVSFVTTSASNFTTQTTLALYGIKA